MENEFSKMKTCYNQNLVCGRSCISYVHANFDVEPYPFSIIFHVVSSGFHIVSNNVKKTNRSNHVLNVHENFNIEALQKNLGDIIIFDFYFFLKSCLL